MKIIVRPKAADIISNKTNLFLLYKLYY